MSVLVLTASVLMVAQAGVVTEDAAVPQATTVVPYPAPQPPPAPGSPAYQQDRARREGQLREQCLSEQAIDIIVEQEDAQRARISARQAEWRAVATELTLAAHAEPLDLERLEAAQNAFREHSAAQEAARDQAKLELLLKLTEADRRLYARRSTPMRVWPPPAPCPVVRR